MTNNQRFAAELTVLLTVGSLLWANATPTRQDEPEELKARAFSLVDKNGYVQGGFTYVNGALVVMFNSRDKKDRMAGNFALAIGPNGEQTLSMTQDKTKARIALNLDKKGNASLELINADGKNRTFKP